MGKWRGDVPREVSPPLPYTSPLHCRDTWSPPRVGTRGPLHFPSLHVSPPFPHMWRGDIPREGTSPPPRVWTCGGETVCGSGGETCRGSGGETCREGKWRGDVCGSGGETCVEVEGRHVGK